MNLTAFDVETTKHPNCFPQQKTAKLVALGFKSVYGSSIFTGIEEKAKENVEDWINSADCLVTFNGKFDINWLKRIGIWVTDTQIWDVQVAHYILNNQETKYPSLNDVCDYYGLPHKLDVVKTEYWDKGLDTTDVPWEVLSEYLKKDLELTLECAKLQIAEAIATGKYRIIMQSGWDLLCLAEMECNGMAYDIERSMDRSCEKRLEIEAIDQKLSALVEGPINWGAPQQVAKVLYGGEIKYEVEEEYLFTYKDARKAPKMKRRKVEKALVLPTLVTPLEHKGEPVLSVDDGVIRKLRTKGKAKKLIELLKERNRKSKLVGTYLSGIPKANLTSGWEPNLIHSNLNQVKAITGRLSSDKPNLQNIPDEPKELFVSRYAS